MLRYCGEIFRLGRKQFLWLMGTAALVLPSINKSNTNLLDISFLDAEDEGENQNHEPQICSPKPSYQNVVIQNIGEEVTHPNILGRI